MAKAAKKGKWRHIAFWVILLALAVWTFWGNTALELNYVTVTSQSLPKGFDGYRIALVSDLHNAEMGNDNEKLVNMLKESTPDIIAITGDIIDGNKTDVEIALSFAEKAMDIAPCYYISGNHEALAGNEAYAQLKSGLEQIGVTVLDDKGEVIEKNGEKISIIGVGSSSVSDNKICYYMDTQSIGALSECEFTVALFHYPNNFESFVRAGVDLVLCGHTHGGQFRLPFIGGLYVPSQGWLPEYDSGTFELMDSTMVISRGIGNSRFPLRFNNRPEVVLVELKTAQ